MRNPLSYESYPDADVPRVLGRARRGELGPVLRVLVWNILKAKRRDFIVDFLHLTADRDLVLLQEAVLNAPSDSLFTGSERHEWVMARSFRQPRTGIEHGVKTGSSAVAIERSLYRSRHSEPLSNTRKLILANRYRLRNHGQSLLVVNMHAINFVTVRKYLDHLSQLDQVLGEHAGPVLLAGDFNTWNARRLASFLDAARTARLTEASMARKRRLSHLNMHLDHLFYRGLQLRDVASLEYVVSSDHAPITATFLCPNEPPLAGA